MTTNRAAQVAAQIRRRIPDVGVKKLHKLLYYCQGHHLAAFGRPLFSERIFAWDMGPVVPALWHAEKNHAPAGIDEARLGEAELNTIGYVISRYGRLTGADLERLSHHEPPWADADRERQSRHVHSAPIPHAALRAFFGSDDDTDDTARRIDPEQLQQVFAGARARLAERVSTDSPETLIALLRA